MSKKVFMSMPLNLFALVIGALLVVSSCKKKPADEPTPTGEVTNAEINQWVVDSMRYYYYWNTSMPGNRNLDFDRNPESFFETLLNRPADRFSWIQNLEDLRNNLSGVIKTSGLGYAFYRYKNTVVLSVRYVHKGSPADEQGIKRGDLFVGVNGQPWHVSNESITNAQPLVNNEPFSLIKGIDGANSVEAGESISLTPVENFQERAIHLDSVIVTPSGTKVGYIFYNRFLSDQALQLIDVFATLKAAGVTELIIDERYNSGGSVGVAGLLAALVHKDFDINTPFIQYEFNSRFRNTTLTYGELFGGAAWAPLVPTGNLGLNRVFVLATNRSASASELLINNLRPIMGAASVIHIGSTTVGKDDASITISNSSSRFSGENDWGIQPIILKYKNRNGEGNFVDGLTPTHAVDETVPFAPMGAGTDPLIAKALSIIDPSLQAKYNRQMGINRIHESQHGISELIEYNKTLTDYYPLDVTHTLGSGKKPLKLR